MKENGSRLVGQCEISHPMQPTSLSIHVESEDDSLFSPIDDLDGTVRQPNNVLFDAAKKGEYEQLNSRISRMYSIIQLEHYPETITGIGLYYINAYGSEIHPSPNPDYLAHLAVKDVLVYSCGSLWTRYDLPINVSVHAQGSLSTQYHSLSCSTWRSKCYRTLSVSSCQGVLV